MLFSIILFKQTGFNLKDIPYNADVITKNYQPHSFDAVWLLQNKGVGKVRINATWDEVDGADYCVIQKPGVDVWYYITNMGMLNENTCELNLTMDALTTIGLEKITAISGWCIRKHPKTDNLFENVKPEPWTPTEELVLDQGQEIKLEKEKLAGETLVGATFNLSGDYTKAQKYINISATEEENSVVVPLCPMYTDVDFIKSTTVSMRFSASSSKVNTLPLLRLFNVLSNGENINKARSLSLDTGITCSYFIPPEYVGNFTLQEDGYNQVENAYGVVASNLPYQYTTGVLNKKVFSLFNTYTLSSICSGDSNTFEADEIYHSGDVSPKISVWADLSPEGNPYFRPEYYKGNNVDFFMECIKGSAWQNTPIGFSYKSGVDLDLANFNDRYYQYSLDKELGKTEAGAKSLGSLFEGNIGDSFGGVFSEARRLISGNIEQNIREREFNREQQYRTPDIKFPRSNSIQNFIGNSAWLYRVRLSANDVKRFDKFLSMYGYAVDEELTREVFHTRKNFNYVQCEDVTIKADQSLWIRQIAEAQLSSGVRIWHTAFDPSLYTVINPVVS